MALSVVEYAWPTTPPGSALVEIVTGGGLEELEEEELDALDEEELEALVELDVLDELSELLD
ncbi:MAG TPA: hypothetical protein VME21_05050 [Steroidobacteraceae bacterium]|nr:hypothetical protein [Steroidobacteraceae bacterium]